MTIHTKLCDLLGVTHPIMLAGMGGVSYAELVAAGARREGGGVRGGGVGGAVKRGVKGERAGCGAGVCQGGEGGGHTGRVGTLPLVAQAVEAVKIPVVGAGGLYDGRGLAAMLSL